MFRVITAFVLILIGMSAIGQNFKKGDWVVGVEGGVSYSNLVGIDTDQHLLFIAPHNQDYSSSFFKDGRWGVSVLVRAEYFVGDTYSLLSGVQLDNKGISLEYTNDILHTIEEVRFAERFKLDVELINNYITVPVLLRKYFLCNQMYVEGGLYGAFNIKSDLEIELIQVVQQDITSIIESGVIHDGGVSASEFYFDNNIADNTNGFDYGLSFGTGFNFPVNDNVIITTGIQLNYGLRDVGNHESSKELYTLHFGEMKPYSSDYYGLDAGSSNVSVALRVGIAYCLTNVK